MEGTTAGPTAVPDTPPATLSGRTAAGILAALIAVVAAAVAVVGPAGSRETPISWPSAGSRIEGPAPFGTPLLLTLRFPRRLDVSIPCSKALEDRPPEPSRTILLTTSRHPADTLGVTIGIEADRSVHAVVASKEVAAITLPSAPAVDCRLDVRFSGSRVTMQAGDRRVVRRSIVPSVAGLYSDVVGRPGHGLRVRLTLLPQDTSPTGRQWAALALAVLAAAIALWVLAGQRVPRRAPRTASQRRWDRWDTAVALTLGYVCVVGPALQDDGWIAGIVANRDTSGTFSSYLSNYNGSAGFGFAHQWLLWLLMRISDHPLLLRAPAALAGLACWRVVRTYIGTEDPDAPRRAMGLGAVAVTFLTMWWANNPGMRPEPLVALFVGLTILAMQRYRRSPDIAWFAAAVLAAVVAAATHPNGIVAAAPVLVSVGPLWHDATRRRLDTLLAYLGVALAGGALGALLVLGDTDLSSFRDANAVTAQNEVHAGGIANEIYRYRLLFETPSFGFALRRVGFALAVLSVGLVALRRIARRGTAERVPVVEAATFVAALALLAVTPSKWPFHLGVLAVPAAAATWRAATGAGVAWRRVGRIARVIGGTAVAAVLVAVGLWPKGSMSVIAISPVDGWLTDNGQWLVLPAVGVVGAVAAARWFRGDGAGRPRTSVVHGWALVGTAWLLVAAVTFGADIAIRGGAWSLAGQDLGLDAGDCGPAQVVDVADPRTGTALAALGEPVAGPAAVRPWVRPPRDPGGDDARAESVQVDLDRLAASGRDRWTSEWFDLRPLETGEPVLYWVRSRSAAEVEMRAEFTDATGARLATRTTRFDSTDDIWDPDVLTPPSSAVRIRFAVGTDDRRPARGAVAITLPSRGRWTPLARLLRRPGTRHVAAGSLSNTVRCGQMARAGGGLADVPEYSLGVTGDVLPYSTAGYTFGMALDAYPLVRMAVWERRGDLGGKLRVQWSDRRELLRFSPLSSLGDDGGP